MLLLHESIKFRPLLLAEQTDPNTSQNITFATRKLNNHERSLSKRDKKVQSFLTPAARSLHRLIADESAVKNESAREAARGEIIGLTEPILVADEFGQIFLDFRTKVPVPFSMAKDRLTDELKELKLARRQLLDRIAFRTERGENSYDLKRELESVDLLLLRMKKANSKKKKAPPKPRRVAQPSRRVRRKTVT